MSKYDDEFWVKISPTYFITNDEDELEEMRQMMVDWSDRFSPVQDDIKPYQSCSHQGLEYSFGGRFNWALGHQPRYKTHTEPLVDVQLLRFWSLQMAQQIVNDDSFTDQSHDNVDVGLTEEELKVVNEVFRKTFVALTKHTVDKENELIGKKKPKFKFKFENETSDNNQEGPEDEEG